MKRVKVISEQDMLHRVMWLKQGLLLALTLCACGGDIYAQLNRYYYYHRTQQHLARGEYIQGIGNINVFLQHQPDDAYSLYFRALCKYYLEDYRGTLSDLHPLLTQRPFMVEGLVLRCAARNQLGQSDSALRDVQLALELRPNSSDLLYVRGVTYFILGNYEEAVHDMTASLESTPSRMEARVNRGLAHLQLGDSLLGEQDFHDAARGHPFSPVPRLYLASFYFQRGNFQRALQCCEQVLKIAPRNPQAFFLKGITQCGLGQLDSALMSLSHSLSIAPNNSLALYNRGLVYAQAEQWQQALLDFTRARQISPTNLFVLYNYAIVQWRAGHPWLAVEGLDRAIVLYPKFAQAYALRAELHMQLGEKAKAKRDYDSAVSLHERYRKGELDVQADSASGFFSRLLAFDMDFSTQPALGFSPLGDQYPEVLPLAVVTIGRKQYYKEWEPVQRIDSLCGGPFFAMVVPRDDTATYMSVEYLPPLRNGHAVTLFEALDCLHKYDYDSAMRVCEKLMGVTSFRNVAQWVHAVAQAGKMRYMPSMVQKPLLLSGMHPSSKEEEVRDYDAPLTMMQELDQQWSSAFGVYNQGVLHYLSRNLPQADSAFTEALEREPHFAEALYNRGLVRILQGEVQQGCLDLSRAGELGLEVAYKAIATHCVP